MIRLGYAGPARFYLCRGCGVVRVEQEVLSTPGSLGDIAFMQHDDPALPAVIRDQSAALLASGQAEQGRLL